MKANKVNDQKRSAMPSQILDCFKLYLLMEAPRSLAALSRLPEQDVPSIATLKRWSVRYGWAELANVHDESVAQQMASAFQENVEGYINGPAFQVILTAKKAFYSRLAHDVQKLAAGGKNPRLFLKINVRDYIRLVRLEHELRAKAIRVQSQS